MIKREKSSTLTCRRMRTNPIKLKWRLVSIIIALVITLPFVISTPLHFFISSFAEENSQTTSLLLLQTYNNPDPVAQYSREKFGISLATIDGNIIVGNPLESNIMPHYGAVYLFDEESGELLQTFHAPSPIEEGSFGASVASINSDIVVGSPGAEVDGISGAGMVFLFDSQTGESIVTIENPTPAEGDQFGSSVAEFGGNVLVGAPEDDDAGMNAGVSYLFDAQNGNLLRTFNPTTSDSYFGFSVAAHGADILIGTPGAWMLAEDSWRRCGVVYLFDGDTGDLLQKFTPPNIGLGMEFGCSIASVDGNVLIGARFEYVNGIGAGAAYLFNGQNGELILDFQNPTPVMDDQFGHSVAGIGDNILVGAPRDSTVGYWSGAVYLFDGQTGELITTIYDPSPSRDDYFGCTVISDDDKVVISAIYDGTGEDYPGAVFLYVEATPPLPSEFPNDLHLWVASSTDTVKLYDGITGEFIDNFASSAGQTRPVDFSFGTDGDLFVSIFDADSVKRFDGDTGQFMGDFVSSGSGGLDGPMGVRFGPDQNMYVSSRWTNTVKHYDGQTGAYLGDFASGGGLNQPTWMFWWNDLYVSSYGTDAIKRYDSDTGNFVGNLVSAGSGGLDGPQGFVFEADGYLYVVSSGTNEVKRYDGQTGVFVDNFVTEYNGGLDNPIDLQFVDDYLYVTSFGTNEVKRFDRSTGQFIDNVVSAGSGGLSGPMGIRILAVLEPQNGSSGGWPGDWPDWIIIIIPTVVFFAILVFVGLRRR